MRFSLRLFTVIALSFSALGHATELPGPVVSAQWLNDNRDAVVVLDLRSDTDGFVSAPTYDVVDGKRVLVTGGGHIEGSRLADFNAWRVSKQIDGKKIDKLVPEGAVVESLMQELGVNEGDTLVLTTPGETFDEVDMAARVYWTLKSYGHRSMAILDGGNAAWGISGYPLSISAYVVPSRGDWTASSFDDTWFVDTQGVKRAMEMSEASPLLIDARPAPQYLGIVYKAPAVAAPGHIEGAMNFAADLQLKPKGLGQYFLSNAQYRDIFATLSISTSGNEVITYCNTGHLAAGAWFIASEIMQLPSVKLFDGSMHEWTTLGHPVVANVK